jgi:hypothetical protein
VPPCLAEVIRRRAALVHYGRQFTVFGASGSVEGLSIGLVDEARQNSTTLLDTRAPAGTLTAETEALRDAVRELRVAAIIDMRGPAIVASAGQCQRNPPESLPFPDRRGRAQRDRVTAQIDGRLHAMGLRDRGHGPARGQRA